MKVSLQSSRFPLLFSLIIGSILIVAGSPMAGARVIYVKPTGNNNNDGSSWSLAKRSITGGLVIATGGDQVWVAAGAYVERINLKSGVSLYGGFTGTESSVDQRNGGANLTALDGNHTGGDVVTAQNCGATTVFDSFIVRNGNGQGINCSTASPVIAHNTIITNGYGGIGCYNGSNPLIDSNTINGNTRSGDGGGIDCAESAPTIRYNSITNNAATDNGGGIKCRNANPAIFHNDIIGNQANGSYGGGIYCVSSAPSIRDNILRGNTAATVGGGIACRYQNGTTDAIISSNLIEYNTAARAAAIEVKSANTAVYNNTIVYNAASQPTDAGGVGIYDQSSPNIANNIVAFNIGVGVLQNDMLSTPQPANNCFHSNSAGDYVGMTSGPGDFTADPLFVNAANQDFHLTAKSPCVNAGDNQYVSAGTVDIDGNARILNGRVDTGAYESPYGFTNLFWRNGASGDITFWQLNGTAIASSGYIQTISDLNWKIVATADLFHNGHNDLIWQNSASGDIVYWELNGAVIVGSGYIKTLSDKNWTIVAAVDLFHNGHTDLIWQNSASGDIVYWDLNGATITGSGYIKTVSDLNWKIVAATDLFHTGHTDLIWQNLSSGDIVYWDLNGITLAGSGYIKTVPDLNWKIVGTTDLFHSGNTDIIWQNSSGGAIVYWDLNGATIAGSGYIKTVSDLNWKIVGIH